jgi:DNA ligase 1
MLLPFFRLCASNRRDKVKMKIHYDRRPRTGIMLAYPFEEKRLLKWNLPYLVQPKYNGLRCIAERLSGGVNLRSSTDLPIHTVPHIIAEVLKLPFGIYDGELYLHESFQTLTSIVNRDELHPDFQKIKYMIFDLKSAHTQTIRLMSLSTLRDCVDPKVIEISPVWACGADDIEPILAEQMALGFEGLILREPTAMYVERRATTMMKLKPRSSDTYRICGLQEEVSIHREPKGRLGAFIVQDADGNSFKVGSGFTHAQREVFWREGNNMIGSLIYVKYQALTDRGVPWFPVFIEVVRV